MKICKITAAIMLLFCMVSASASCAMSENKKTQAEAAAPAGDVTVEMKTTLGDITLKLYGITPKHRDNFVKLVNEGYYDGVLFHRVIDEFMIQTGDGTSKTAKPGQRLGEGDLDYTIEAEFVYPQLFHKRGALAAARQGDMVNPEKRSSGSQFYIVTGRKFTPDQLDMMEANMQNQALQSHFNDLAMAQMDSIRAMQMRGDNAGLQALQDKLIAETEAWGNEHKFAFTPEQREAYTAVGGAPHLDGAYTVFGEVVKGMDVVDKIEKVETDANDRPKEDVKIISMKVVK